MKKNIEGSSYYNDSFVDKYPNIADSLNKSKEKYEREYKGRYIKRREVEDYFRLNGDENQKIRSLRDLSKILREMSDDIYSHHVHVTEEGEKNDFAEWAEKTHKQKKLADKIRREAKTAKETADIIDSDDWVDLKDLNLGA